MTIRKTANGIELWVRPTQIRYQGEPILEQDDWTLPDVVVQLTEDQVRKLRAWFRSIPIDYSPIEGDPNPQAD